MCGIAGFIDFKGDKKQDAMRSIVGGMAGALAHRGPDDHALWIDHQTGIALGHNRLAVIDLSVEGRQPMVSPGGRYVIVYNGEVYNYIDIRKELRDQRVDWRGHSDTEVILAAIETWGVRKALGRFIGMFAFAVWDRSERTLILVRDRLGIKPLYYGWAGSNFVFGSEIKAIKRHPDFYNSIDRNSLAMFFRHNYIPAPYSIYKDIRKLSPGEIFTLDIERHKESSSYSGRNEKYWSTKEIWERGESGPLYESEIDIQNKLEELIKSAVEYRMIADVPLGAFLSGGIDSSLIVATMQSQSRLPVNTFTIGFQEDKFNEAEAAKEVAKHLGTNHTELYVSPKELLDVVPEMPDFYDEPFSDASQIPTYILSKMARHHVTVCLSGDGGDELFSGYRRYFWANSWKYIKRVPYPIRSYLAHFGAHMPDFIFNLLGPNGTKLHWRLPLLLEKNFRGFYLSMVSHHNNPASIVIDSHEYETELNKETDFSYTNNLYHLMSYWDLITYLPDDILTKTDRASMALSLELRVPLLDHRIVEFASRIPTKMKTDGKSGKEILRNILKKYLPKELTDRPKKGFSVPIEKWLREDLRGWAEDLLEEKVIERQGYLHAPSIRKIWGEYVSGQSNWYYCIWDILMFQSWLQKNG